MKKFPGVLGLLISSVVAEALGIVILTLLTAASVILAWIRPKVGV